MPEDDQMKEIIQDFILESSELIEKLDQDLVTLEGSPEDLRLLNQIFRSAHTIKGTSSFLGFTRMTELTQDMESVLNKLRNAKLKVNSEIMDVLLESLGYVKILLEQIKGNIEVEIDLSGIRSKLQKIDQEGTDATAQEKPAKKTTTRARSTAKAKKGNQPAKAAELPPEQAATTTPAKSTESPLKSESERPSPQPEALSSPSARPTQQKIKEQVKSALGVKPTIRVEVVRLDNLMNLVGELVLERNRLVRLNKGFLDGWESEPIVQNLAGATSRIDALTTELQLAVMKTRMLPIQKVFSRIPRMVRDLSRERGKQVKLEIEGEETELDKSVIEEIGDPLVHLIRNAVDYGIETPEEREKAGKIPEGLLELKAYQEGNNIVVEVGDDGKGMDPEEIRNKAIEKGLVSEAEAQMLSRSEILNFIFAPGFSTAKVVTNASGRGVGMDVVKTNIEKLNGIIEIQSEPGKGSRIRIKLPLTLAIIPSLLVGVNSETYAIPSVAVLETARVFSNEIKTIKGKEVLLLRDAVLPLTRLDKLFDLSASKRSNKGSSVVVVGVAERRLGLIVDHLIGQEEVVLKSMGDFLSQTEGIAGAAIMGDGRVTLILDIGGIMDLAAAKAIDREKAAPIEAA